MIKLRWMILAGFLLFCAGCGKNEAQQCYEDGMAALETEAYDTAITCFEKLIEDKKLLAEAYRGYGIAWMEKECYPEAIAAFSRSLNNLDGNHQEFKEDVMFYLAKMRTLTGDLDKAIAVYSEMLKDNDENVQAFFLRGQVYLEKNDLENAEKDFDRAVADSEEYNVYINIYQLYADRGLDAKGNKYLQMALELTPEEGEDYYHRARIFECQELYDEAKAELLTSVESGFGDALLLLGRIYLELEDSTSARTVYMDYMEQSEKKAYAYNGLAQCDIFDGNYDGALKYISQGLAIADENEKQGLLYNEIVAYEYKKEFQTAKLKMEAYLAKYPEDAEALRENEFLSTR